MMLTRPRAAAAALMRDFGGEGADGRVLEMEPDGSVELPRAGWYDG